MNLNIKRLSWILILLAASLSTACLSQKTLPKLPGDKLTLLPKFAVNEQSYNTYNAQADGEYKAFYLPGSGAHGAYVAGIVEAMIRDGNFNADLLVGTSSGALMTLFAYVNDAKLLTAFFEQVSADKIFEANNKIYSLLLGSSFLDNTPLREFYAGFITEDLINKASKAHKSGKRAFVISSNLDAAQAVYWDLGAIANAKLSFDARKQYLLDAIIASTALPMIFNPSEIIINHNGKAYRQLHVDAAVTANDPIKHWMLPENLDGFTSKQIQVLQTRDFISKLEAGDDHIAALGVQALATLYQSQYHYSLLLLDKLATEHGLKLSKNVLSKDLPLNFSAYDFSPEVMLPAFKRGQEDYKVGTLKFIPIHSKN